MIRKIDHQLWSASLILHYIHLITTVYQLYHFNKRLYEFASDNIKYLRISTIIQFATLLEEFRFLLGTTISGVDLLDMALKDGIVALYPYHSHLLGF